ncbi:unnamed protein product [Diamesa serratosioi]
MLEENSVRNLQYDNDLRISRPTTIEPIVYASNQSIISSYGATQNISTVDVTGSNSTLSSYLPMGGLQLLNNIPSIHIHQIYELSDSMTTVSSENRFTVRTPGNEAIFGAHEGSTPRDRMLWGSSRSFMMHLSDRQHQESLTLRRVFGLRCFCLPIRRQKLEVWMPPGILLGIVKEKFSLLTREFVIENEQGQVLVRMSIPFRSSLCMPHESHFRVMSPDLTQQLATITRLWNTDLSAYTINIYFADSSMDVKIKALYLGLGFLLEYLYFQSRSCW